MKPKFVIYVLQRRHGHFSSLQFLILDLNPFRVFVSLMSLGINDHIFGPIYERVWVPYVTVFTLLVSNGNLEQYLFSSFNLKTSFNNSGPMSFLTLYNYIANSWIFFWWTDTELSLINSSSKEETLSLYTNRSDLSWMLIIRLFSFRLWT